MRDLGTLWKFYQANRSDDWNYEKQVIIAGVVYTEAEIKSCTSNSGLILDDFRIGVCGAKRLDVTVKLKNGVVISNNAEVVQQVRIIGKNGTTPWQTLGTYHIAYRNEEKNIITLECYDVMLYTYQPYLLDGEVLEDYPMSAPQAIQRILSVMGVQLDPRTVLRDDVMVPYPNKLTMNEVLGFICSAHGGNPDITGDNKLRLVIPKNDASVFNLTRGDIKGTSSGGSRRIDRLYMVVTDDGDAYVAGTGDTSLEILNLFATQAITDHVYAILNDYEYRAIDIKSADIDPALELGNSITVNGIQVNLWSMKWSSRFFCDISAPMVSNRVNEFGTSFNGTLNSALMRRVALDSEYYGVIISRRLGLQIQHDDGVTKGLTTINSKTWEVTIDGNRVLWADFINKTMNFNGRLSASVLEAISAVITPYIYSENGAIVNAIVRRLRTDLSKPFKYLAGDSSDVHWQDIGDTETSSGRYFRVSHAIKDAPPVQFAIPSVEGRAGSTPLWWYRGIVGGSMTISEESSIPETGGSSTPVMAYQYEDITLNKKELTRTAEGAWGVREQWGEDGRGAGVIEKTAEYMQFTLDAGGGEEIGGWRVSDEKGIELYNKALKQWEYPAYSSDILALTGEHILLDHLPTVEETDPLPNDAVILVYDRTEPFLQGLTGNVYPIIRSFVKSPTEAENPGGGMLGGIPGIGDTPGDYVVLYTADAHTYSLDITQGSFGFSYSGRVPNGHIPAVLSAIGFGYSSNRRNISSLHDIKLAPGQRLAQFRSIYCDYTNMFRKSSGAGGFFGSMLDLPADATLVEVPLITSFVGSISAGSTYDNSLYLSVDDFMGGAGLWTRDDFFFGAFDLRASSPITYSYGSYGIAPDSPEGTVSNSSWQMQITGATKVYQDSVYTVFKYYDNELSSYAPEWKKGGYYPMWYYNQPGNRGVYAYVFRMWEYGANGNIIK